MVCVLLSLLLQAVIVVRVAHCAGGQPGALANDWRQGLHAWLPLLGTMVLCALILLFTAVVAAIAGGIAGVAGTALFGRAGAEAMVMLLLFIAVVFVGVYLVFVQFAVVLEGKRPLAAIDLSFNLVRNNWWRTFWILLITGVMITGVLLLVSVPVDTAFGWHDGAQTGRAMMEKGILQMVLSAVGAPFIAAILYVQYLDLKMRHAAAMASPTTSFQA